MLAGGPVFVHLQGTAHLIEDRAAYAERWHKSLDLWFEDGIDTADLIMIKVDGQRAAFWDGTDHGEVLLSAVS
jgi:general stress protein 26